MEYAKSTFEQMSLRKCCVTILNFIQQIILFIPKKAKSAFMQMSLSKCCITILNFIQQITLYLNAKGQKCFWANVIGQMLLHHFPLHLTNNPLSDLKRIKSAFEQMSLSKCCVTILNFIQQIPIYLNGICQKQIWANVIEQMLHHHSQVYPTNNPLSKRIMPKAHLRKMSLSKCCVTILNFIQQIILYLNGICQKRIWANVIEQMLCHHSQLYPTNNPFYEQKRPKVHQCKCHWANVASPFSSLSNK